MSNYPPGVSGFEPEIAGYDEVSLSVECRASATLRIYGEDARARMREAVRTAETVQRLLESGADTDRVARQVEVLLGTLKRVPVDTVDYDPDECPFEGDVEGFVVGDRTQWTCPFCEALHEDEIDGPDEDWGRDR